MEEDSSAFILHDVRDAEASEELDLEFVASSSEGLLVRVEDLLSDVDAFPGLGLVGVQYEGRADRLSPSLLFDLHGHPFPRLLRSEQSERELTDV